MAYIGPLPAETFTSFATQEFSTSATTSYTLDHPVTNENELALFINNVRQQPGSGKAYTASGTALTLSAATASTDTMYAVFLGRALQTVNPADASVGTAKLAATSVTAAKLNNDIISGTTALAEEPADTDEFLLSDGGTLKRIDYSYIKGGGGLVHIKTQTVSSGVASVDFINGTSDVVFDSTYNAYKLVISDMHIASDSQQPHIRYRTASSFETSGYQFCGETRDTGGNETSFSSNSDSDIRILNDPLGNATDETFSAEIYFHKPTTTDTHKLVHGTISGMDETGLAIGGFFSGTLAGTVNAITGFQIRLGSGNIDRGNFSLYGLSTS
jgi:hypothetical protein